MSREPDQLIDKEFRHYATMPCHAKTNGAGLVAQMLSARRQCSQPNLDEPTITLPRAPT